MLKVLLAIVLSVYLRCLRCSGPTKGEVGGEATAHREPVTITLLPGKQGQGEASGGSWGFLRVMGFRVGRGRFWV